MEEEEYEFPQVDLWGDWEDGFADALLGEPEAEEAE